MAAAIEKTRGEIAAIRSDDQALDQFVSATGELEEITAATERATSDILENAEKVQELCEELREDPGLTGHFDTLEECTTNIFLACSFQDITGQRTTKVVNALKFIEQRVNSMISIWGINSAQSAEKAKNIIANSNHDDRPDADLMAGPAASGEGVSQDDIDALLGGAAVPAAQPSPSPSPAPEPAEAASEEAGTPKPIVDAQDDAPEGSGKSFDQTAIDDLFS